MSDKTVLFNVINIAYYTLTLYHCVELSKLLEQNYEHEYEWYRASVDSTWWRHQMEPFSALLALCAGNSPVPVNSPHKGQWRGALMFPLICAWIHDWINNREAGDLRRYRGHYDVNVMKILSDIASKECHVMDVSCQSSKISAPGPRLNIKTVLSTYGDFHVKDKTAVRTSYL